MHNLAMALLRSSALFASSAMAQTGAATTNAAGSQANQASLADCDRLITLLDKEKAENAKVKPDTVREWKRDNKAGACHDTLAQLEPNSARQQPQQVARRHRGDLRDRCAPGKLLRNDAPRGGPA